MRGGFPLKTALRILVIIIILCGIGFYWSITEKNQVGPGDEAGWMSKKEGALNYSFETKSHKNMETEGLFDFIGKNTNDLEMELGRPERVDVSPSGYHWWIYKLGDSQYVQMVMKNNKVVMIYAAGKDINIKPFYIGQPISEIYSSYFIESILDLDYNNQTYHFELSEEDINFRPIIRVNTIYVQLFIDKFSGTLSSIRLVDVPTLIKVKPFDYRDAETDSLLDSDKEDDEVFAENQGKQIFEITNMIRSRFGLIPLEWDEQLAQESYIKSKELYESNLFSLNENGEEVERFRTGRFEFVMPGENIAVHYLDPPAIVEGWFNSEVHRKNLLSEEYTHVGVGVYKNYFTQKFVPDSEMNEE